MSATAVAALSSSPSSSRTLASRWRASASAGMTSRMRSRSPRAFRQSLVRARQFGALKKCLTIERPLLDGRIEFHHRGVGHPILEGQHGQATAGETAASIERDGGPCIALGRFNAAARAMRPSAAGQAEPPIRARSPRHGFEPCRRDREESQPGDRRVPHRGKRRSHPPRSHSRPSARSFAATSTPTSSPLPFSTGAAGRAGLRRKLATPAPTTALRPLAGSEREPSPLPHGAARVHPRELQPAGVAHRVDRVARLRDYRGKRNRLSAIERIETDDSEVAVGSRASHGSAAPAPAEVQRERVAVGRCACSPTARRRTSGSAMPTRSPASARVPVVSTRSLLDQHAGEVNVGRGGLHPHRRAVQRFRDRRGAEFSFACQSIQSGERAESRAPRCRPRRAGTACAGRRPCRPLRRAVEHRAAGVALLDRAAGRSGRARSPRASCRARSSRR